MYGFFSPSFHWLFEDPSYVLLCIPENSWQVQCVLKTYLWYPHSCLELQPNHDIFLSLHRTRWNGATCAPSPSWSVFFVPLGRPITLTASPAWCAIAAWMGSPLLWMLAGSFIASRTSTSKQPIFPWNLSVLIWAPHSRLSRNSRTLQPYWFSIHDRNSYQAMHVDIQLHFCSVLPWGLSITSVCGSSCVNIDSVAQYTCVKVAESYAKHE